MGCTNFRKQVTKPFSFLNAESFAHLIRNKVFLFHLIVILTKNFGFSFTNILSVLGYKFFEVIYSVYGKQMLQFPYFEEILGISIIVFLKPIFLSEIRNLRIEDVNFLLKVLACHFFGLLNNTNIC